MSYLKAFILFISILFLASCSSDDPEGVTPIIEEQPTSETYFTLIANVYETEEIDNWVIIHDRNGNLLDYKPYENEDNLTFEALSTSVTDKISITLFSYFTRDGYFYHDISTSTEIEKGTVWDQALTSSELGSSGSLGNFTLSLNNFPELIIYNASNELGSIGEPLSGTGIGGGLWNYNHALPIFEKNNYLFTFLDNNQDFRYYFLDNMEDGVNISLDYSEFNYFDHFLNIDLPPHENYFLFVDAYPDDQNFHRSGYAISYIYPFQSTEITRNPLKIGYLDRFTHYKTRFNIKMDGFSYNYQNYGSKPTEIIVPEKPSFIVENESVYDFKFSTDVSFLKHNSIWRYENGEEYVSDNYTRSTWRIKSLTSNFSKIGQIPDEIQEKYTNLNINNIQYVSVDLSLNMEETITIDKH